MKHRFEYEIALPAEEVWFADKEVERLIAVSKPLLKIKPVLLASTQWEEGGIYRFNLKLFGFIPWSTHVIRMKRWSDAVFEFETEESGGALRYWRHRHRVKAVGFNRCRVTDEIDFAAGIATPLVWSFSKLLYRKRRLAWKRIEPSRPS